MKQAEDRLSWPLAVMLGAARVSNGQKNLRSTTRLQ